MKSHILIGVIVRGGQNRGLFDDAPDLEENKTKKNTKAELELLSNRDVLRKAREMMQFHDNKLDAVDAVGKHTYFLLLTHNLCSRICIY